MRRRRGWRLALMISGGLFFVAGLVAGAYYLFLRMGHDSSPSGRVVRLVAVAGPALGLVQTLVGLLALRSTGSQILVPLPVRPVSPEPGMTSLTPPPLVGLHVHGRDRLVDDIIVNYRRRRPSGGRVHVLHGLGGVGKTTVAQLVAQRLGEDGVTVWWISAAEAVEMQTGLRQLARQLGATAQELDYEWADNAPEVLWRRLRAYDKRWLLVFDNADDASLLTRNSEAVAVGRGWVRPVESRYGGILVTTREGSRETWGSWCRPHEVPILTPTDGAKILLDHVADRAGSMIAAAELSERLEGLALALDLIGRYLAQAMEVPLPSGIDTFDGYRRALETEGLGAAFGTTTRPDSDAQARRIVEHTWELSLCLLEREGLPEARTVLRLLAAFAPAAFPHQLVLDPARLASTPLLPGIDAHRLRKSLRRLEALGLLDLGAVPPDQPRGSGTPASLRLHLLIRDASLHHLQRTNQAVEVLAVAGRLLAEATKALKPTEPAEWPSWRLLAPHPIYVLTSLAGTPGYTPEAIDDAVGSALQVTEYLAATGLYTTAQAQAIAIRDIAKATLPAEHPTLLKALHRVAQWTAEAGDCAEARDLFAALLPVRVRVLGADDRDTLTTWAHYARAIGLAGNALAACAAYETLLPTCERVLGADDLDVLTFRADFATWTGRSGKAPVARDTFAELLPAYEQALSPEHPRTLEIRVSLAAWTGESGRPADARDQFSALLPTCERVQGPEHPATLAARGYLAMWVGQAGEPVTAREQYAALLPVCERVLGARHPETLNVRAHLATWTGEVGDADGARDQYSVLLPDLERVQGPEHPDTLTALVNRARWVGEAGEKERARKDLAALVPVCQRVHGPEHPATLTVRADLARWTGEAGDAESARDQFAALLPACERVHGVHHPATGLVRAQLAEWTTCAGPPTSAQG